MKALHIKVGQEPAVINLPDKPSLEDWQRLVGGGIEAFDVMDGVCAYVNDEGVYSCAPNRAVWTDASMAKAGYLSQLDGRVVEEGDLYTIIFGDFVIFGGVSYSEEDDEEAYIGLTDEQIEAYTKRFEEVLSGALAVTVLQLGVKPEGIRREAGDAA